jgi:hypothetical protein
MESDRVCTGSVFFYKRYPFQETCAFPLGITNHALV